MSLRVVRLVALTRSTLVSLPFSLSLSSLPGTLRLLTASSVSCGSASLRKVTIRERGLQTDLLRVLSAVPQERAVPAVGGRSTEVGWEGRQACNLIPRVLGFKITVAPYPLSRQVLRLLGEIMYITRRKALILTACDAAFYGTVGFLLAKWVF